MKKVIEKPSREDLVKLLFSDPASECWEADGFAIVAHPYVALDQPPTSDVHEASVEALEVVASEVGGIAMSLEGMDAADDLEDIAIAAKRGAILLLVAAWGAEREAGRLKATGVMGTKNKPGNYDCYANAEPDEPMFVLLARDEKAPALVEMWAGMAAAHGSKPAKVAEARACAEAMRSWRARTGWAAPVAQGEDPGHLLRSAIRAITVEAPDDLPNGAAERTLLELQRVLDPDTFWYGSDPAAQRLDAARVAAAGLCEALADDTKRLREAAEAYFGGDFRAPVADDGPETQP